MDYHQPLAAQDLAKIESYFRALDSSPMEDKIVKTRCMALGALNIQESRSTTNR